MLSFIASRRASITSIFSKHSPQAGGRVPIGNDIRVQISSACLRSCSARFEQILLFRKTRSADGFPHQALSAIAIAVRKLRSLAPAHFMTAFSAAFKRVFGAIHIVQRIDIEAGQAKIGIG